jgi:hypothetical protein
MEDGRWEMEDGRWKMGDGRWKMEDGRWKIGRQHPARGECVWGCGAVTPLQVTSIETLGDPEV